MSISLNKPLFSHSILELFRVYKDNEHIIKAHLKGESVENFKGEGELFGVSIVLFLVVMILALSLWIWAIVALIKYGKSMPEVAMYIAIASLIIPFFGGPILTLILVYATKK